jgi:hypothetical protein
MSETQDIPDCEAEASRLLPWFLTGRLSRADARFVQAHLDSCGSCRDELEQQRRLRDAMQADVTVAYAPQSGLQRLLSRIDEMERELPAPVVTTMNRAADAATRGPARTQRWLTAAVVVQAIGLGLLGSALWWPTARDAAAPVFHTLTSAPDDAFTGARIRLVPAPRMTMAGFKTLLESVPASVIAGPTEAGVYTLAMSANLGDPAALRAAITQGIERLRAHPEVLLAEPVDDPVSPKR